MARSETGRAGIGVSLGRFESTLEGLQNIVEYTMNEFEASLTRISGNLATEFDGLDVILDRLELRLDDAGAVLSAVAEQTKATENRFLLFLRALEDFFHLQPVSGTENLYKTFSEKTGEKLTLGFVGQDPGQLEKEFAYREEDVERYGGVRETNTTKGTIDQKRHEQKMILEALKTKLKMLLNDLGLDEKAARASGMSEKEIEDALVGNKQSIDRLSDVLENIKNLATSEDLRNLVDKILDVLDRAMGQQGALPPPAGPQQTGARETSPQDHQVASAFGPTIYPASESAGRSMQRLDESLGETAQGYNVLTEALQRFVAQGGSLTELLEATIGGLDRQSALLGILRKQAPDLAETMAGLFERTTEGAEGLNRAVAAVGDRFLDAFEGAIVRGESLGGVLKSLARDLAGLALNEFKSKGFDGIFDILGGLFSPNAKGNAFSRGRALTTFARGGAFTNSIVNRPTLFPMADGAGLMGEAGPEAVLPLTRLANGELGVRGLPAGPASAASGPVYITINAPGADRGALQGLTRELRRQGEYLRWLDRTMDRRAVEAVVYTRGRGGNIARAFGGW